MVQFKSHNIIKFFALISFITLAIIYWANGLFGLIILLFPYVLVFLLANDKAYCTTFKMSFRVSAAIIVCLMALGIIFGIEDDPQAGIGILFAVVIQCGVIFVSEAIIALFTYQKTSI